MARTKNFDMNELFGDIELSDAKTAQKTSINHTENHTEKEAEPKHSEDKAKKSEKEKSTNNNIEKEIASEVPAADLEEQYYHTRGRKGAGWEILHIRVTSEIKRYINHESCRRGIPKTLFINQVIEQYMNSPQGRAKVD